MTDGGDLELAVVGNDGAKRALSALYAELARLRAENLQLRKERALLLESQTYWMSAAGGRC